MFLLYFPLSLPPMTAAGAVAEGADRSLQSLVIIPPRCHMHQRSKTNSINGRSRSACTHRIFTMLLIMHVAAEDGGRDDDDEEDAKVDAFSICRPHPLPEALENATVARPPSLVPAFCLRQYHMHTLQREAQKNNNMIECAI